MALTQTRVPISDLLVTGTWTPYPATPTTRWDKVDDGAGTKDDDAGYIIGIANNNSIDFGFDAFTIPAGSTISEVRVYCYAKDATSGVNSAKARLSLGATPTAYDHATVVDPHGTVYTLYSWAWTENPGSLAAWTVDEANGVGTYGLKRLGFKVPDAAPDVRFSSAWIECTYEAGPNYVLFAGTAVATGGATGALKRLREIAGAAQANAAATAALKAIRRLAGVASSVASATLAITVESAGAVVYWAGTAAATLDAALALKRARRWIGDAAAVSSAELGLKRIRGWAGTATAASAATLIMRRVRSWAGGAVASSAANAALKRLRGLAGQASANTVATAAVRRMRRLAGAAAATSAGGAVMGRVRRIAGTAEAVASASLALTVEAVGFVLFAGQSVATASATVFLRALKKIAGTASAQSGGSLTFADADTEVVIVPPRSRRREKALRRAMEIVRPKTPIFYTSHRTKRIPTRSQRIVHGR